MRQQPPWLRPPASVVVFAAAFAISSMTSFSSSPVTAEHSAYRSQSISWADLRPCNSVVSYTWNMKLLPCWLYLLWVNQFRTLNSQIPLQSQQHDGYVLSFTLVVRSSDLSPDFFRIDQASSIADIVTQYYKLR